MLLVDSSVWVEDFRGHLRVTDYVRSDEIATCPLVMQEALQGVRSERAWREVWQTLSAAALLEPSIDLDLFIEAAQLYRKGRSAGFTIRKSADCVIAAIAIAHDMPVLHADRDFDTIARFSALQARNVYA